MDGCVGGGGVAVMMGWTTSRNEGGGVMLRGDVSESPGESGGDTVVLDLMRLALSRSLSFGESGGDGGFPLSSEASTPEAEVLRAGCTLFRSRSRMSVPLFFDSLKGFGDCATRKLPDFFLSTTPSASDDGVGRLIRLSLFRLWLLFFSLFGVAIIVVPPSLFSWVT